jgi:hypothetical protein
MISPAYIPHVLAFRVIDVVIDVAGSFSQDSPKYLFNCIEELVERPGDLSLQFSLDGKLETYFEQQSSIRKTEVVTKARRWMEGVMESEGRALESQETLSSIVRMVN